jgi:hypothetical protein
MVRRRVMYLTTIIAENISPPNVKLVARLVPVIATVF